jgi:hypothetical protein
VYAVGIEIYFILRQLQNCNFATAASKKSMFRSLKPKKPQEPAQNQPGSTQDRYLSVTLFPLKQAGSPHI